MRSRTSPAELEHGALEALVAAIDALGLETSRVPLDGQGPDLVLAIPGRGQVLLEVKAAAIPTAQQVRQLAELPSRAVIRVLVTDQIPVSMRDDLNDVEIGWLDRRGHLRLVGTGLYIDTDVPPRPLMAPNRGVARDAIRGRSGRARVGRARVGRAAHRHG